MDSGARTDTAAESGKGDARDDGLLVGRDAELAELAAGLDEALAGRGRLFSIAGEPGIGKTRLADALSERAQRAGALVLWGRCWEAGGAPAYWPWTQVVRTYLRQREGVPPAALTPTDAAHVAKIVPELAEAVELPEVPALEPDSARFALFDGVTRFLKAAAQDEPLLIVLDDLHGADQPSLRLLQFFARELRESRIITLGAYRETEARLVPGIAQALAELGREGRRLTLRGLSQDQVGAFVEALAGTAASQQLAKAIHEATEGNPLFVDEVVRLLDAEGQLGKQGIDSGEGVRIPDGVRDAIRQRLEPLPADVRGVLRDAAVIGREFTLGALQHVCDLPATALTELLSEACAGGTVVERSGALGRYGFSHALIRETLYGDLTPAERVRMHSRVGAALEELYAADPEQHLDELAHHFFQAASAGELGKAIEYSVAAGRHAMELLAYEEAAGHFERALQVFGLEERADVPRRCDLLLALGEAQSRAGDASHARETFQRAAGLARKLGSAERLAHAALGFGAGLGGFELGRVDQVLVGLLREAHGALGERDTAIGARVLGRLAVELYSSEQTDERLALSRDAVEMARRVGDSGALASVLSASYLALWGPENVDERLGLASEIVRLGQEANDHELALRGHVWRWTSLVELGDLQAADLELESVASLAEALRDPLYLWYTPLFRATRAMLDGRFEQAEELARSAFEAGRRTQARNATMLFAVQMYGLRWLQGRLAELEQQVSTLARDYPTFPVWRVGNAHVNAALGRDAQARAELDRLASRSFAALPRDGEWLTAMSVLSGIAAELGEATHAAQLYELLVPHADYHVVAGRGAACFGPVSRYAGQLAATLERYDEAESHYEHAQDAIVRMGSRPLLALLQHDRAALMLRRGGDEDEQQAQALLTEAAATAAELGMASLAAGVATLRGETPPPTTPVVAPGAPVVEPSLRREGDFWAVSYGEAGFMLKDAKGVRHLARLLDAPETEFHALDLVGGVSERAAGDAGALAHQATELDVRAAGEDDAGELLDAQAKRQYRERLEELREDLEEAESFNDPERAAHAREEMEFIAGELAGAVGLGGRDRKAGSTAERARVNVTRALRTAVDRIGEHDDVLGHHLNAAIKTGTFCSYQPGPGAPEWEVDG